MFSLQRKGLLKAEAVGLPVAFLEGDYVSPQDTLTVLCKGLFARQYALFFLSGKRCRVAL